MASFKSLVVRSLKESKLPTFIQKISFASTRKLPDDKVTHTGQKWEKDDYRLARFINHEKHVNPNVALDLINAVPPAPRKERVVWCDGDTGSSTGHPRVYINLDKPGNHSCSYCGLRFYKKDHH